ncbi:hypothetical protein AB835_11735 [Candidatus Endobugula sertula]|uniref:Uncharacterized protein n=1 Tax=Candidatus Endobugula sertula TaxID=62101 RepID=A0A1D2QMW2_9GAMM|nr:hypothetical protein AB835_11735 [Candidatus Endobugula sertula]
MTIIKQIPYIKGMKVDIDTQTANYIKEVAALGNTSPETLAAEMLSQQALNKDHAQYWRERAEDMATLEAMRNGDYISEEAMLSKMDHMIEEAKSLAEK